MLIHHRPTTTRDALHRRGHLSRHVDHLAVLTGPPHTTRRRIPRREVGVGRWRWRWRWRWHRGGPSCDGGRMLMLPWTACARWIVSVPSAEGTTSGGASKFCKMNRSSGAF